MHILDEILEFHGLGVLQHLQVNVLAPAGTLIQATWK